MKILYFMAFFMALSEAFPGYIKSSFVKEYVPAYWVGLFFVGSSLLTLFAVNFFPVLIKRFSNFKVALSVILINIASIVFLITVQDVYWFFVFFIIFETALILRWINMDIFLERITANPTTGKTRTLYLTYKNVGWLISPVIVGFLVGASNYRLIYLCSIVFLTIALIMMIAQKKRLRDDLDYEHQSTWKTIRRVFQRVSLRCIFSISFLLQLFYSIAVIYMPIYLNQNLGFSWQTIGLIFTFMLIPFVVLEIPAGIIADKYSGEKKILILGFLILISSTALFFFTKSTDPIVWAIILFLSRCGASLIEAMRESYFFKIIDVEDIDYINLFRDIRPLAYLVGSGFGVLVLKFLPLEYIFLFLAIILISGLFLTASLKRIENKR